MMKLTDPLPDLTEKRLKYNKIGSIEIFRLDCKIIENCLPHISSECICGLLKISSNGLAGWGEYILPCTKQNFDIVQWASVFVNIKGLSIPDGMCYVQSKNENWGQVRKDLAETALMDLDFQLQNPFKRQKYNNITLERSFLIEHSQAYFSF
ncbi:hypothetical protein O9H85_14180 [Paenibacillus filicis]|uniref:Uncharacterized protein n=1 Tax=Paenibacillus gyeongsangnamensis TaxID=3388067 RepID=A0ABT4Q9V0_9BACL|nr:hypothetical protein [Paenibacillus filicis]MCZ8513561.1 hypothetical protein [Paenibacillus filicis]